MPRAQQNRKRRKPYVYLDPSRFTCTSCRASFKSAVALKRHYTHRCICQPDSDSDAENTVENVTIPDLCLDTGNVETFDYPLDLGGEIGEGDWTDEPGPEASDYLDTESALKSNITIPSDPSQIEDIFEEQYPNAGSVKSCNTTLFQHIASNPSYKDTKSSHKVSKACYPFKDPEEVEMVNWLLRNRLSKASINEFLQIKYVSGMLIITLSCSFMPFNLHSGQRRTPLLQVRSYPLSPP